MTTPLAQLGLLVVPEVPAPEPAHTDAVYARQWRKALEDAQWSADGRQLPASDSGSGDAAARSNAQPAGRGAQQAQGAGPFATAGREFPTSRATDVARLADSVGARVADAAAARLRGGAATNASLVAGGATVVAPDLRLALAVRLRGASAPPLAEPQAGIAHAETLALAAAPEWPSVAVRASISARGVSIAVRAATLDESDALDLFYRLRDRLRAAGHALHSLVVNGRELAADAATHAPA
jgi:hypothetical protein